MKPFRTLLFFLTVFLCLFAIALYFPDGGIKLTDDLTLHFVDANDIFSGDKTEYADIEQIINQNNVLNDSIISNLADTTKSSWDTVRANADSLRRTIHRLEFPGNDPSVLYPIFKAFNQIRKKNELVRILHYGDSQIEGDRMTSLIRNKLQKRFGGSGVGLVPASQAYDFSFSLLQKNSDNWYRYTAYGNRDTTLSHNRYGALASFATFVPDNIQSSYSDTTTHHAWISFDKSWYGFSNTRSFRQCRIFYGFNKKPFINEIYQNDHLIDAEIFAPTSKLKVIDWKFDEPQSSLTLKFSGAGSPEIYGIALDDMKGVAVDNIAMRGSAGLIFTKMDRSLLRQMYKQLNVKLVILQYGGNVIPYISDNGTYYEKLFYKQLTTLRSILPHASFIVVGVADMSKKEKNKYISYPNIEIVRDALKKASFDAGVAFWDMYEAMGGKNSMPSWVFANPPLASKDFVHFNPQGAKIIAQMFYNAFIYEYEKYEKSDHPLVAENQEENEGEK